MQRQPDRQHAGQQEQGRWHGRAAGKREDEQAQLYQHQAPPFHATALRDEQQQGEGAADLRSADHAAYRCRGVGGLDG
ncbi:hypothetical protein [Phytopseudomonas flavescens]|uniref:hypothetical protein n=1 Tax=Phytopseudomonas flavescens TaxID=29435 RepID=UPI000A055E28|nr:hypothetical protein [Pseudomonas flavescens]